MWREVLEDGPASDYAQAIALLKSSTKDPDAQFSLTLWFATPSGMHVCRLCKSIIASPGSAGAHNSNFGTAVPIFGHHSSHSKKGCPRWHHSAHFWASVLPCQKQGARVGTTVPILGTTPPRPHFFLFWAPVPMGWHESGHAHVRICGHPKPIMGTNPAGSQKNGTLCQ